MDYWAECSQGPLNYWAETETIWPRISNRRAFRIKLSHSNVSPKRHFPPYGVVLTLAYHTLTAQGYYRHTQAPGRTTAVRSETMAEPEEEMEALKRAYAEMILNAAKEAAARVMAADLRTRRLEKDLVCTKEEAARLLVYSKRMIESKTKEAETTYSDQQKKIDVLEAQLNEAEGIIMDLRSELNQTHEQVGKSKNKKLQTENSEVLNIITPKVTDTGFDLLTSFRNGCTQRIHPTETNTNPSNIDETVSIIRRSMRKRKLKFMDYFMSACGLGGSNKFKKPRVKSDEGPVKSEEDGTGIEESLAVLSELFPAQEKTELSEVSTNQEVCLL